MKSTSYLIPSVFAALLHMVVVVLLAESWFMTEPEHRQVPRHVQAQLVDFSERQAQQLEEVKAKAQQKAQQEKRALERQKEAQRQAELKRQQEDKRRADKKKAAEAAKQKAVAEKQRLAEKKKQEALALKKKAEAAAKQKAAVERKRKQAEAKKQADAEQKRLADEKRKQAEAEQRKREEQQRQAQELAVKQAEAARRAESQRQAAASYEGYIKELISRNWRRSPGTRNEIVIELSISLLPTGKVVDVQVTRSSGDSRIDEDAIRAVQRVDRFEKLQQLDPVVFDRYYRRFTLRFRPEDLRW
ncbi:cell envelope integrity protein TolA [Pontibacter sp. JAM-7]|uniref:cell envelope integrity protein TolA n=1 Tax=Pontibacter sp. JAM-7 TaxID=3366581 RepID=UPI003AF79E86